MAVTTRATRAPREPPATDTSSPKAPSIPKAVTKSKSASQAKSASRTARRRASPPPNDRENTYRVRKSHSRRRHRRSRRHLSESSTDSEEEDRPMASFLHHQEQGTRPFFDLAARFPTVPMKYFKQIFYGTFLPENLTKLGQGIADRTTSEEP